MGGRWIAGVSALAEPKGHTVDCTARAWRALNVFVALETGQCVVHTNEHMTQLERIARRRIPGCCTLGGLKTCAKRRPGIGESDGAGGGRHKWWKQ